MYYDDMGIFIHIYQVMNSLSHATVNYSGAWIVIYLIASSINAMHIVLN